MLAIFKEPLKTVTVMTEKELRQDNWRLKGIIDKQSEKIKHLESELNKPHNDQYLKVEINRIKQLYGTLLDSYNKLRAKQGLEALKNNPINPDEIILQVCKYYDISVNELTGRCRKRTLTRARQVVSYVLSKKGYSLADIGKMLGNRDHSTIIYSKNLLIYSLQSFHESEQTFINSLV